MTICKEFIREAIGVASNCFKFSCFRTWKIKLKKKTILCDFNRKLIIFIANAIDHKIGNYYNNYFANIFIQRIDYNL